MSHTRFATLAVTAVLLVAACGDDGGNATVDAGADAEVSPAAGTCLAGADDCDDVGDGGGADGPEVEPGDTPAPQAMCAEDTPDCDDMVVHDLGDDDDTAGRDEPPTDEAEMDDSHRARAEAILGAPEDELDDDVRISRRGDEFYALTEDYVVGRLTVELDQDANGVWTVVAVTVELRDGPETIQA